MQANDEMTRPAGPTANAASPDPNPIPPEALAVVDPMVNVVIRFDPETIDGDGFVSIWNVAAATMDNNTENARVLASKLLGFLCKHQCDFVFASSTDASYLDERFERDNSLLYDWSAQSEKVDILSQHAQVPAKALVRFLKEKKFDATKNHSPRRADRVEWFTNQWCIG
jgi:hypothetical protein